MEDQEPYTRLISAMKQQAEEDKEFMAQVHETFEELNLYNSTQALLLLNLADILIHITLESGENPTAELELDEEHGAGINMYSAIGSLYDYIQHGDSVCLDVALAHIMREKERLTLL